MAATIKTDRLTSDVGEHSLPKFGHFGTWELDRSEGRDKIGHALWDNARGSLDVDEAAKLRIALAPYESFAVLKLPAAVLFDGVNHVAELCDLAQKLQKPVTSRVISPGFALPTDASPEECRQRYRTLSDEVREAFSSLELPRDILGQPRYEKELLRLLDKHFLIDRAALEKGLPELLKTERTEAFILIPAQCSIGLTFHRAIQIAGQTGLPVVVNFNQKLLAIRPGPAQTDAEGYRRELMDQWTEARESDRGRAEIQSVELHQELQSLNKDDPVAVMRWLRRAAENQGYFAPGILDLLPVAPRGHEPLRIGEIDDEAFAKQHRGRQYECILQTARDFYAGTGGFPVWIVPYIDQCLRSKA